jgi:hypothetical protein
MSYDYSVSDVAGAKLTAPNAPLFSPKVPPVTVPVTVPLTVPLTVPGTAHVSVKCVIHQRLPNHKPRTTILSGTELPNTTPALPPAPCPLPRSPLSAPLHPAPAPPRSPEWLCDGSLAAL